jgi:hypothetical protein
VGIVAERARWEVMNRFPVLLDRMDERKAALDAGCPRTVPWSLLAPHEDWAKENHDQSLRRLADRGGLDPTEMVAILERRKWRMMTIPNAVARLLELLAAHEEKESPDVK